MSHLIIVSFLTSPELRDKLRSFADATDRTISEAIEEALVAHLQPTAVIGHGSE